MKAGLELARSPGRVGGRPRASVAREQVVRLHQAGMSLDTVRSLVRARARFTASSKPQREGSKKG